RARADGDRHPGARRGARMRSVGFFILFSLAGCDFLTGGTAPDDTAGGTSDPSCQIQAPAEHGPGYPYDLPTFRTQVLGLLTGTCGAGGCHAAPSGNAGFTVWTDAQPGNCSYAKTFNSFVQKTDVNNPSNSAVYVAV